MDAYPRPPEGADSPHTHRAYLLLVEDEFLIRMVVCDALRDEGYSVIEACSGDEAVEILQAGVPVDLILSDVRMPGAMDGLALLAFVRRSFPKIPVIVTSGDLPADLAIVDGARHFLRKPFQIKQALDLIEMELDECR